VKKAISQGLSVVKLIVTNFVLFCKWQQNMLSIFQGCKRGMRVEKRISHYIEPQLIKFVSLIF